MCLNIFTVKQVLIYLYTFQNIFLSFYYFCVGFDKNLKSALDVLILYNKTK